VGVGVGTMGSSRSSATVLVVVVVLTVVARVEVLGILEGMGVALAWVVVVEEPKVLLEVVIAELAPPQLLIDLRAK